MEYLLVTSNIFFVSMFFMFSPRDLLKNPILVKTNMNIKKEKLEVTYLVSFFSGLGLGFLFILYLVLDTPIYGEVRRLRPLRSHITSMA